jgi:UDP-glucose 4-epimerase
MMTIVITGAAGFLGRHLVKHPGFAGKRVIPVSRHGRPGFVQVADYRQSPEGDLLIHLAEEPDRGLVNKYSERYVQDAAKLVANLANRANQRIIYASSGAVYGDEREEPCKVGMPVGATDAYSRAKLQNERIVLDAGGCVVRFSNLVGLGMSPNNVLSDVIRQVPGKGPLYVRDDGPVRDFLSVRDAVSAVILLANKGATGIFNVGSGIGTSVRKLAEMALAHGGDGGREIIASSPSLKRSVNVLDISETTNNLGWTPLVSIQEQLAELFLNKVFLVDD